MSGAVRKALVALASFGIGLLAANRAADRWLPIPSLVFRLDPVLLHALVPGARRVTTRDPELGGGTVVMEIDSSGFRGPEVREPKRGPRVVVYGDSLVMADSVDLDDTFVERLASRLREDVADVEVVNAGVTGYGPDQVCLKLEREVDRLAPDLVVLVLCAHNDFGDLVRNKIFRVDERGDLVLNRYLLDASLVADFAARERESARPALVRAVQRCLDVRRDRARKAAAGARTPPYVDWYLAAGTGEHSDLVLDGDLRVRTLFEDYYDADLAIHPEWESSAYKRRLMEPVLGRIRDACRRRRIPLVALVVPSAVDVVEGFEIRVDPALHPTWSRTRLTGALAEILARLETPFLDLHGPFEAAGPERLFLGHGDFHWNAAGQDLAADLTAGLVRSRALWPPRERR